ncbi:MAG TPA: hypothetical protein EYG86_04910 [Crocinitomicaceae bacterium]|nr:hypothetical protein [Crocinitomicaceae bacterium]
MKTLLSFFIIALSFISFSQTKLDSIFIYFNVDDSNSELIKSNGEAYQKIDAISSEQTVTLIGCTDTSGTESYNQALASRRIDHVKSKIINKLSAIKTMIIGEVSSFRSLAQNRCVILVFEKRIVPPITEVIKTLDTLVLNLTFINNQDILLPESRPIVEELFDLIDTTNYIQIQLHGHVCCGSGQQLSLDRAKRIQKHLIRRGVDATKIKSFGHSNLQPRYPEINEENKKKNRRVEAIIVIE